MLSNHRIPSPFLLLFLTLVLLASHAQAASPPRPDSRILKVERLLSAWKHPATPGAIVTVTLDGHLVATVAAGSADLEHPAPIGAMTSFHAASLSKQFTAFAILLLEQDGKLSIDAPLSTYLPESAAWPRMTLRQLLNHTSGLRDEWTLLAAAGWRAEDLVTDEQVTRILFDQRGLNFAPGSMFQYNNSGYALLADVVRRVSGKSLGPFCAERMFGPLGMTHTHFQDNLTDIVPQHAQSYRHTHGHLVRAPLNYATVGSTGLQTTSNDLSLWARNFESPRVGGAQLIARMQTQGILNDGTVNAYAMGQERRAYHGFDTWSHGGRDAGYRTFLLRIPSARFSVVVLGNADDVDTAKIAFAVADIYLASHPAYRAPPKKARTVPTAAMLANDAGDYELFPGLIFTLSTDGDALYFALLGSSDKTRLPALSASAFALNARDDIAIEFDPAATGPASGFDYRIGLHGKLPARRIILQPFAPTAVRLEDFKGHYDSAELHAAYELTIKDGRLTAQHVRGEAIALHPYQTDLFNSGETGFQKLQFQRDAAGRVSGFLLSGAMAEDIVFKRTPE